MRLVIGSRRGCEDRYGVSARGTTRQCRTFVLENAGRKKKSGGEQITTVQKLGKGGDSGHCHPLHARSQGSVPNPALLSCAPATGLYGTCELRR